MDSQPRLQRKAPHSGLVAIKVFSSVAAEKALERHQRVTHENIIDVLDAFTTVTSLYIVLEHLPITLLQIVEGTKYPDEWQLAAILKQLICGLGNLKITNLQYCEIIDERSAPPHVRALGVITIELMQKIIKPYTINTSYSQRGSFRIQAASSRLLATSRQVHIA
ncbi:hypothetical protein WAI453_012691 [Rhynchosporium graminicola]